MDEHARRMEMLRVITAGFDAHDLDAILAHFADDAVFESARGTEAHGTRFVGIEAVREAFAGRFSGIPDVPYQEDEHFVDGDCGASEWTLRGTTTDGERLAMRGCDLWTRIAKKDSYWKIRTVPPQPDPR